MVRLFEFKQPSGFLSLTKKKGKSCCQKLSQLRDKVNSCLEDFHSNRQSILKI